MHRRIDDALCGVGRHCNHGDVDVVALRDFLERVDVLDANTTTRFSPDFRALGVKQRQNLKPLAPKSRVVREGETEIAGAQNRHAHRPIEPENRA